MLYFFWIQVPIPGRRLLGYDRPEIAIFVAGTGSEEELLVLPLLTVPPPNSIPHKPGIVITFPVVVFGVPSDSPWSDRRR